MTGKYPEGTGRRRFVKGVVGGAGLTATAGAAGGAVDLLTPSRGTGGGPVEFYGVQNVGGPAPRPMPQIPITVEDGVLRGRWPEAERVERDDRTVVVAREAVGGVTYDSRWFQYCGLQATAAVAPDADRDTTFRHPENTPYAWQRDLGAAGEPLRVEQFDDYADWDNDVGTPGIGKPALAVWRGDAIDEAVPVQVIRSERVAGLAGESDWLAASTTDGFLAYVNKCTHFCCVPGFKQYTYEGAEDLAYCPCHQSVYDPFSIVRATYTALPRPDE